jgi:hypothetical protein
VNPMGYPPNSGRIEAESAACFGRNMGKVALTVKSA